MRFTWGSAERSIRREDAGFTLVEVSIITVIIGVLSSIAVPTFLSHTNRAHTSAAETDIRSVATAMEAYFVDAETYGSVDDLVTSGEDPRITPGTSIVVVKQTPSAFCLAALRNDAVPGTEVELLASAERWFDSAGGGVLPAGTAGCPVTSGFDAGWQTNVLTAP